MASTSPAISADAAMLGSGIQVHSTRSTLASLPPASPSAGSGLGL
jgi:hypothetical protein